MKKTSHKIINSNINRLEEIVSVNYEIFNGMYEQPPYSLNHYKEKLKDKKPIIFIAEKEGSIIGDLIAFDKNQKLYIWILGVVKKYRNQGIASELLNYCEKYACRLRYRTISVKVYNVSKEMLRLLIARGYQIIKINQSETDKKYNTIYLELNI